MEVKIVRMDPSDKKLSDWLGPDALDRIELEARRGLMDPRDDAQYGWEYCLKLVDEVRRLNRLHPAKDEAQHDAWVSRNPNEEALSHRYRMNVSDPTRAWVCGATGGQRMAQPGEAPTCPTCLEKEPLNEPYTDTSVAAPEACPNCKQVKEDWVWLCMVEIQRMLMTPEERDLNFSRCVTHRGLGTLPLTRNQTQERIYKLVSVVERWDFWLRRCSALPTRGTPLMDAHGRAAMPVGVANYKHGQSDYVLNDPSHGGWQIAYLTDFRRAMQVTRQAVLHNDEPWPPAGL